MIGLQDLRTAIVAVFAAQLPGDVAVAEHPGRFDLAELKRWGTGAPAVRVAVLDAAAQPLGGEVELTVSLAAFVITRSDRTYTADVRALVLGTTLLVLIDGNRWGLDTGAPQALTWRNLYATDIGKAGAHLSAVQWTQSLTVGAVDEGALDAWITFFADYDLGPEPDGQIDATDNVTLEQP